MKLIRILALASGLDTPDAGRFLSRFDPEAFGGRGLIETTPDPLRALAFDNGQDALREWQRTSRTHPIRANDGRPNRPLTAYTVEVVDLADVVIEEATAVLRSVK